MRYFLIIFFLWGSVMAQPVIQRTSGANTVNDPNLMASKSLIVPVYADTSAANATGTGLDSIGKIIYSKADTAAFIRAKGPIAKFWQRIGSSGGAISTKLSQGGDSFGANLVAGTNDNYPVTFIQNGLERARIPVTTGNLLINTISDDGVNKLQVNGAVKADGFNTNHNELGNLIQEGSFNVNRTEDGTNYGLSIGTGRTYGLKYILFQSYGTTFPAQFNFPSAAFVGDLSMAGALTLGSTSGGAIVESDNADGINFLSGIPTNGRDISKPILKIGNDGHAKIATNPTTSTIDNYAAALDIQSTTSGFLPPRMTTAQRDSLTGIFSYKMTNVGSGYVSPVVTISGGGGSGAVVTASPVGGQIYGLNVVYSGSGYTSQPTITITDSGGGTGATAVAKLGYVVEGLTIYNLTTHKMQVYNGTSWNDLY